MKKYIVLTIACWVIFLPAAFSITVSPTAFQNEEFSNVDEGTSTNADVTRSIEPFSDYPSPFANNDVSLLAGRNPSEGDLSKDIIPIGDSWIALCVFSLLYSIVLMIKRRREIWWKVDSRS